MSRSDCIKGVGFQVLHHPLFLLCVFLFCSVILPSPIEEKRTNFNRNLRAFSLFQGIWTFFSLSFSLEYYYFLVLCEEESWGISLWSRIEGKKETMQGNVDQGVEFLCDSRRFFRSKSFKTVSLCKGACWNPSLFSFSFSLTLFVFFGFLGFGFVFFFEPWKYFFLRPFVVCCSVFVFMAIS